MSKNKTQTKDRQPENSFDFTVATIPCNSNIDRELQYIKASLLYADRVRLISPIAYFFLQLSDKQNSANEHSAVRLMQQILSMIKLHNETTYYQLKPTVDESSNIVFSTQYRSVPMQERLKVRRQLREFTDQIRTIVIDVIGIEPNRELQLLIDSGLVIIEPFKASVADIDGFVDEFFLTLSTSVKNSYPLFDKQSNDLMKTAIECDIIDLSEIEKNRIQHAGMANDLLQRLPSFEQAGMDEVIDIKKELKEPVGRFRGKMLGYSDNLQSLPWDSDFKAECSMLFDKDVFPAIKEIEEAIIDNNILKNIAKSVLTDPKVWIASVGGITISIAAEGVIPAFASIDALTYSAGAAFAGPKIVQAYGDYKQKTIDIKRKDLYFYYKAGELLREI